MKTFLVALLLMVPWLVQAKITMVTWGVSPASPVYVGQTYDLTLTIETDPNEEIAEYRLTQGPKIPSEKPIVETVNGRRRTIFRWQQVESNVKLVAIPEGELLARVMVVQTFGFARYQTSTTQQVVVPAFSYEVVELPGEARGAPIGNFALSLTADQSSFSPGEVRVLTATLVATEGAIPETMTFALKEEKKGRLYPFRVKSYSTKKLVAEAYYVTEGEQDLTLGLQSFKAFDLVHRQLTTVYCSPLILSFKPEEADATADVPITLGQGEVRGLPLRYAPTDRAPVIGVLVAPVTRYETYEEWTRVACAEGEGWIRTALLGENQ